MKPNLPSQKVKKVLVDKNICPAARDFFKKVEIDVVETVEIKAIDDCTSTHPDMQFLLTDNCEAIVEKTTLHHYLSILPDFNFITVPDIYAPYPNNSILNVTIINDICLLTSFQNNKLSGLFEYNPIIIKQGYSKCNICVLNSEAIITSDYGIIKKCSNFNLRAYYLPDNEITLNGYKNGFWGGATGLIDKDVLFFCGDIEKLNCYTELKGILSKEKIEPVFLKGESFTD